MGQYDETMKSLVDNDPEALTRFILHEWQKQQQMVLPLMKITAVKQLNSEFQSTSKHSQRTAKRSKSESESEELAADSVLLVEGPDGPLYLIELEFQSNLHPYMPLRSLEYLIRAKKKHWKTCGHLPVLAAV